MTKTNEKPKFEEVAAVTTMNLPDVGLRFNAQRVGPTTFRGLRETDYGEGFRMPTMPEIVPLVYASLGNKNYDTAKNVVKTLKTAWVAGDTVIHYFPEGMFVEDIPKMKSGRIVTPTFKVLEKRLGSHMERGVIFSDDKSIRFTPYEFTPYKFKRGSQTSLELSTNTGIIALVGGKENAEKLAKASKHYRTNPYFWVLENVDSPVTRVAVLGSHYVLGDGLGVGAAFDEDLDDRCSFGVLKDAENPQKPLKSQ